MSRETDKKLSQERRQNNRAGLFLVIYLFLVVGGLIALLWWLT